MPGDAVEWLRAWDSQGFHRTGTDGDEAGAAWLAREAAALGAAVTSEAFALDRIDPVDACLELEDGRIDAVPVFDAPPTGPDGVSGTLGPAGSDAAIGVAELSPQSVYSGEYQALRRNASHRALVIVCRGAHPGLGLLNAEGFRAPYGAPAIHVASEARAAVLAAAATGSTGRLVAHYRRTTASARNIVVDHRWSRSRASAGRGDDAAQFLVAIHRRTRRRSGVLAAVAARAARRTAGHGRRADRQQRTRTGPSRPRRVRRPTAGLGTRCAVAALGRQSRGGRRPADRDVGEPTNCAHWPRASWRVRASRRMCSRPQRRCRVARRATSIVPADAMSRWSAAIPGSICRRTAGRMRWTWTRWNASLWAAARLVVALTR